MIFISEGLNVYESLFKRLYSDFFFQAEDGIRDRNVTGVQTCALPIFFSLYDRFDKVLSVSELAHKQNSKNLKQHVSDERKMDYVVNPIDYEWILNMKDWGGLRSAELAHAQSRAVKMGEEFPENNEVSLAKRGGNFDSEFAAEIGAETIIPGDPPVLFPLPSPRDTNFITIGRLSPEKDHAKLIRSFARVAKKYPR